MTEETTDAAEPSMDAVFEETTESEATEDSSPEEVQPDKVGIAPTMEGVADPLEVKDEPKVPESVQARFNELTRQRHEAERSAQAEKDRADRIEQQLRQQTPGPDLGQLPKLSDPDIDYNEELHQQRVAEYYQGLIKQEVVQQTQQVSQMTAEQQAQAARDEANRNFAKRIEEANIEDYHKTIEPLLEIPFDPALLSAVQEEDNGPQIFHYLGKNLDVADRLSKLHPVQAAREVGKISVGLSASKPKQTTRAPDPIKPAKGGGNAPAKSYDDMSMDEIYNLD